MTIDETILIVGNITISGNDENYNICQYQEAKAIAIEALEFKKNYQYQKANDFNETVDACQNGFNEKVQKCIEKINKEIDKRERNNGEYALLRADGLKIARTIIEEELGVKDNERD